VSFDVIYRVVEIDAPTSDRYIAAGWRWLCQDWACPKMGHCGKHFGLSKRYAAMQEQPKGEALLTPSRSEAGCRHYVRGEQDHFAASLGQRPAFPVGV